MVGCSSVKRLNQGLHSVPKKQTQVVTPPNPPALARVYAWFSAVVADDLALLEDLSCAWLTCRCATPPPSYHRVDGGHSPGPHRLSFMATGSRCGPGFFYVACPAAPRCIARSSATVGTLPNCWSPPRLRAARPTITAEARCMRWRWTCPTMPRAFAARC